LFWCEFDATHESNTHSQIRKMIPISTSKKIHYTYGEEKKQGKRQVDSLTPLLHDCDLHGSWGHYQSSLPNGGNACSLSTFSVLELD
jgi:hypothetical protein